MRTRSIVMVVSAAVAFALAACALFPSAPAPGPDYWPTEGWRTAAPEDHGFDSAGLAEHLLKLRDDGVRLDSLLLIRNGYVLLDAYFAPYDGSFVHDMASVTKSITTTLIGIAAGQGKLDVDAPVLSYFPDRTIANVDARKEAMTVRHLAGMVSGFESGCLDGDEDTLDAMRASPDWMQAALDRPMMRDPGLAFCYDSPGMHILSGILQETTGMTEEQFARENLFGPLGIRDYLWEVDPQGYTDGWGDLHLFPRDAAKLTHLFLNDGAWDGVQIVPEDWVRDAVTAHVRASGDDSYGLGWWVSDDSFWALGRGGQHVKAYPEFDAIVMVTAASLDYDQLDPLLRASFVGPTEPLPANPEGVAALEAAVAELARDEWPHSAAPVPAAAQAASGVTYVFGEDAAAIGLTQVTFEFPSADQGILELVGPTTVMTWPFGLDGTFTLDAEGRAIRGRWTDDDTLVLQQFDIGTYTYYVRFEADRMILTSDNFAGEYVGTPASP